MLGRSVTDGDLVADVEARVLLGPAGRAPLEPGGTALPFVAERLAGEGVDGQGHGDVCQLLGQLAVVVRGVERPRRGPEVERQLEIPGLLADDIVDRLAGEPGAAVLVEVEQAPGLPLVWNQSVLAGAPLTGKQVAGRSDSIAYVSGGTLVYRRLSELPVEEIDVHRVGFGIERGPRLQASCGEPEIRLEGRAAVEVQPRDLPEVRLDEGEPRAVAEAVSVPVIAIPSRWTIPSWSL